MYTMNRTVLLYIFSFVCCISVVLCEVDGTNGISKTPIPFEITSTPGLVSQYRKTNSETKSLVKKILRRLTPVLMKELYRADLSQDCLSGLLGLLSGIRKLDLNAVKMIDASAKVPVGLLVGTLSMLGNYEECVGIDVDEGKVKLKGQYCKINIEPPIPEWRPFMSAHVKVAELVNISDKDTVIDLLTKQIHNLMNIPITTAVCIPSLCSADDLQKMIQIIPQQTGLNWKFDVKSCEVKTKTVLTDVQIAVLVGLGIVGFLLCCGSIVDMWWTADDLEGKNDSKGTFLQILRCFSIFENLEKIGTFKPPEDATRFVYGLMFLTFIWVDCGNTLFYANFQVTANLFVALEILQMVFYEVLLNRILAIQTLFFISGLVSSYRVMKSEEDICAWKYILYRYLRYTPAYLLSIALVMLVPILGSGPTWNEKIPPIYSRCKDSWWANIFYVNNIIDPESACLDNTWMFAIDAQLHVLSLLVLIPLKKKPKFGLMLAFATIASSLLAVALTNVYYDIPPAELAAFINPTDRAYYSSHTYHRVYTHFCIYCSGIIVGYLAVKKPHMNISDRTIKMSWFFVGGGLLAVLCSIHHWHKGVVTSPLGAALYAAFSKAAHAVCLSWLGYVCCTGRGGVMNSLLGWRVFGGLSRLTFLAFLFNPVVINLISAVKKTQNFAGHFQVLYWAVSYMIPTLLLAFGCYLAFEAPTISILEMMKRRCKSRNLAQNMKIGEPILNGVLSEKPMRFSQSKTNSNNETIDHQKLTIESNTKF